MLRIGVVIPTLGRGTISLALQSLIPQDYNALYVNKDYKVRGASWGRNQGILALKHLVDIIAFVDDDAIPANNWISQIRKTFMKNPKLLGISGIVVRGTETPLHPFDGSCTAYRVQVFDKVKFNENTFGFEDLDFIWRCVDTFGGDKFMYTEKIYVHHPHDTTSEKVLGGKLKKGYKYISQTYPNRWRRIEEHDSFSWEE